MSHDTDDLKEQKDDFSSSRSYKIAEKILKHEQAKELKHQEKKEKKVHKETEKINQRKEKAERTKKLLSEASFSEMNTQQKIWSGIRLVFYAGVPFFMYMLMPAIVISIGTALFSGDIKNIDTAYSQTASNFYTFIGIICALLYLVRAAKKRGTTIGEEITFSMKGVNWKYIGLMSLFGFCASVFVSAIYTLLPDALMAGYDSYTLDPYNTYDVVLLMLSLIILDPIAEEIIFRGYMLNRLLPPLGEKVAVIIVTAVFALCHLSPFWILYGIALGYVLAKISIRHDNIIYSIAIHIGFNLPTLFNYLIVNHEKLNRIFFGNRIVIAGYAILFGTGAYLLMMYFHKLENTGIDLRIRFFKHK